MLKSFATESEPGKGILVCQCRDNRTQFSRIHAQYPLKFIPTKAHAERLAAVYMLSYGGGIVSGDLFDISLTVEERAILLLMTQGNTKVFKDGYSKRATTAGPSSIQYIVSHVHINATLLVLPDPVTSFKNSSFSSRQTFNLADDSSRLVLLDWFTSGRLTRGEKWSFKHYSSKIDVRLADKLILRDHMVLDDDENTDKKSIINEKTSYADRLSPYTCFATLVVVGVETAIRTIERKAQKRLMATMRPRDMLWSASPFLKGKGMLVRVAGVTTEQVRDFVKLECLGDGLTEYIGDGMFAKVLM
ncbi:urease accessory protein UreD [Zychaea mexicana]|uniref:urease accessory protein UreD n=1 Tax=Zychaea mexicana TaxID=64656 RepID=UPI0022FE24D5|nr:urease accessory protein UreD [Zychaea mexicana]KAI9495384.1 urease accessory protein UreD [Zychaea mexicana]